MCEKKFRAWDKDRGVMCTDLLVDYSGKLREAMQLQPHEYLKMIAGVFSSQFKVMQFTGLHDKNGNKIYEGDILRGPVIKNRSYVAECPSLRHFHWYQELDDALNEGKPIEVIGNIYENPELMKEEG